MLIDRLIGVLNGVMGDYLEEKNNPLSIPMTIFYKGSVVKSMNDIPFVNQYKIIVFLHGLTDTEHRWEYMENEVRTSFGKKISEETDFIPLFIRYNTGLHISQNGEKLHHLLQVFFEDKISLLNEIIIVGFSMGGLVTHSAIQFAKQLGGNWESKLNKVFLIGSPHQGAPLERAAHQISGLFKALPQPYLKLAGELLDIRSNGIKDLRYGYTRHEEWDSVHLDEGFKNRKKRAEVFHNIMYFLVAGSIFSSEKQLLSKWLGDLLVPIHSALGHSENDHFRYQFKNEHILLLTSISHLQLATDERVLSFITRNLNK